MRNIKIKNINGEDIKVKVFTKTDLREKLGFNDKEIKLIMKYQKTFPELLQDKEGFIIDGETLCKELGVKSNFNNWLLESTRYNNNGHKVGEGKLIKYRCIKEKDYISDSENRNAKFSNEDIEKMSPQQRSANRIKNKIQLTLECAKKIAMRQNNKQGDLVCDYFILMEKALRKMDEWLLIRHPERAGYKELCKHLDTQYKDTHDNKQTPIYIYTNEANMINICLLGKSAKEIRDFLKSEDNNTREHLNKEVNKALYELQLMDSSLIIANLEYDNRKSIIEKTCKVKYSDLILAIHREMSKVA